MTMRRFISSVIVGLMLITFAVPAQAITVLRDAELEQALKQLARPILQAAGLGSNRVSILVVKDSSLNAFVADSRHIFITSALIRRLRTPQALQAVIAHEVAHIANGHITRRAANARVANRLTAVGFAIAAIGAAKGNGQAAVGLAAGTASSAQRIFFSHTRAEEASADQSGLRYMALAGIDPAAMTEVLDLFRGQEALKPGRQDPYARTHPLTRDRLRAVRGYVASLKTKPTERTSSDAYWFARMDAKLQGFLGNPRRILRGKEAKGNGEIATLRRAIAYHRLPDPPKAIRELGALLSKRPRDPFYHELRGQILLESGNAAAAVSSYQTAASLLKGEPLILGGLGRALLAQNTKGTNREALRVLTQARSGDPGDPGLLRDLALAHARNGQPGLASAATAERYAIRSQFDDAEIHAKRAMGQLPRGSQGWLRAQDVLQLVKAAEKQKKRR